MTTSGAPEPSTEPRGAPSLAELLPAARQAAGRFSLAGLLPILAFYVLFRLAGPTAGIFGGMGVSLTALAIQARRLGRLDPIVIVPMLLILIQGSLAAALDSIELYLLVPAVENVVWGLVLVGSVAIRRPLVRVIAAELRLVPVRYGGSPSVRRALSDVTLAWGLIAFVKAAVRVWLLYTLPLEGFLIALTLFNSALNGSAVAFSFWWALRAARA